MLKRLTFTADHKRQLPEKYKAKFDVSSEGPSVGKLGADYMESFRPGLSFSPVKRAEIASRLHEQFELGLSLVRAIFIVNPG